MRRAGNLKSRIVDYDNILLAVHKAFRGKRDKNDVKDFLKDFENNVAQIFNELLSGTIEFGNYNYFKIFDPKERLICAASIKERIVHHALMNICHEYFDRKLIFDSYATRPGKGIYSALEKAKRAVRRYKYFAKLDVRKYYDSIDHEVLKRKVARVIKDRWLLNIFDKIIESYSVIPGKGLPIGNLTSQYLANLYLSDLDHYMKESVSVPIYVRYMDDVLILMNNKEELKSAVRYYIDYAYIELKLTIKPPIIGESLSGIPFLGYTVKSGYLLLSGKSKRRFRHKLNSYDAKLKSGEFTEKDYSNHIIPLLAFTKHASCKSFRMSCLKE